jgi:hypothetical protein
MNQPQPLVTGVVLFAVTVITKYERQNPETEKM